MKFIDFSLGVREQPKGKKKLNNIEAKPRNFMEAHKIKYSFAFTQIGKSISSFDKVVAWKSLVEFFKDFLSNASSDSVIVLCCSLIHAYGSLTC